MIISTSYVAPTTAISGLSVSDLAQADGMLTMWSASNCGSSPVLIGEPMVCWMASTSSWIEL